MISLEELIWSENVLGDQVLSEAPQQGRPAGMFQRLVSHRDNSLNDCRIIFVDEVFKIERPGEGSPVVENPMRSEF